ncbi:Ig-like domain-containing protein [Sphaerotilus sp.]|uniref:Ig-like domain-containing protein n=1 Tax=Sphaerotilus sp. TaxID=2093942 RepID=UPI002ACE9178|nr:Ig-like domain-containing protein [Sphaerotilus sp.]MDZ7858759.1 Ig-like domain-containing protein [Sphaerotilus sp.]
MTPHQPQHLARQRHQRIHRLALASAAVLALAACGGGGGGSSGTTETALAPSPSPAQAVTTAVTLSGTVATGAALVGATLTVTDATGAEVGRIDSIGADGQFSVTLSTGAQAPFVLVAKRDDVTLVSVQDLPSSGTVNVTPITTLVASRLSPSGDPTQLGKEIATRAVTVDTAAVNRKVEEVRAMLKPVLDATGTTSDDLLRGRFDADGRGHDKLLDSLKITITPDSASSANIQITVRQQRAEGEEPAEIRFNSAAATAAPVLPAVERASLVEDGTSPLIADLMTRLSACYALPVAERVSSTATSATGSAITAPACTGLFVDNNPTGYLHSGLRVGTSGAFGGIFRAGATGVVFSRGSYEFSRENGDLVVGFTTTNPTTQAVDSGILVVRKTDDDTGRATLRLIGNQYAYDGGVSAYHQQRHFITLNQSGLDYDSIGYTLNVSNTTDSNGQPIFDRVVVTTPRATHRLVLKPLAGSSYLGLLKGSTTSNTNFLRLRSTFADATVPGHPSSRDTSLFFADNDISDSDLAGMSAHSVWKFEYYLASNPDAVAATQHFKTRARPMTIAELRQRGLAQLADSDLASVTAEASPINGRVPLPATGSVTMNWTVPDTALAPTNIKLWGRAPTSGAFNDQESVLSTARTGSIRCSRQTTADAHCDTSVAPPNFVGGATADGVHLWARDVNGREFARFYAMYKLAAVSQP